MQYSSLTKPVRSFDTDSIMDHIHPPMIFQFYKHALNNVTNIVCKMASFAHMTYPEQ